MFGGKYICTSCGTVGNPKRVVRGSILMEIALWLFFILPGLIYSVWRLTTKYNACPECKNATMIPITSPLGQKLLSQQTNPIHKMTSKK